MKKLLKIIILIQIFWVIMPKHIFAQDYKDYMLKKYDIVPGVYVTKKNESHQVFDYMYIIARKSDKQFVYCIEPGIHIKDDFEYQGVINGYENSNLNEEQYNKIKLISYYGYGYVNQDKKIDHTDKKWYAATQGLIWEIESNNHEIYFTNYLQGPKVDKYSLEYAEIKDLIKNHNKKPSFKDDFSELYLGEKVTLLDSNNVLSEYNISLSNDNIRIKKEQNTLTIEPLKIGSTTITLTKTFDYYNTKPLVYIASSSQNLFSVGNLDPISIKYQVTIKGGEIIINKVDSESGSFTNRADASLVNAKYNLYDENNNVISNLIIDKKGKATTGNILFLNKKYFLKEETPSTGYKLDDTVYEITLDKTTTIKEITVKEEIIKRKVEIYKVLGTNETKILTPESNISFNIYLKSSNKLFYTITTNTDGYASITLPYGVWIFEQINSTSNYEKVNNFEININDDQSEPISKIISDAELETRIRIRKIDSETNKLIPLDGIKFKIKNIDTNEYICQTILYPTAKTICEYETKNGIMITPQPLRAGNYELIELKNQYIKGYQVNDNPLRFSINENTIIKNETNIGNVLELEFKNTPSKTHIEIIKIDKDTLKPLPNALINIYNIDDELLISDYTNDEGIIKAFNLPLGKYYFIEKQPPTGYKPDYQKNYFELTENDTTIKLELANQKIDNKTVIHVPNTLKNDNKVSPILLNSLLIGLYVLRKNYE